MALRRHLDRQLKMHHLRAVDVIVSQGSLLKASAVLGLSQPALTKILRELEDIVQEPLFRRLPRGVQPTPAGSMFARYAGRILGEVRRLDRDLDDLATPDGGTVAVGALPVAANGVLPGALIRLRSAHPGIRVTLRQGRMEELVPLLTSGDIDLIVGRLYEPTLPDGFLREPLWEEPFSILVRPGHPILGSDRVTVAELRRYELVLPTISQRVGQEIDHILQVCGMPYVSSLRSSSYGLIREMLYSSDTISVMPRLLMAGDLLRGTLRFASLPGEALPARPAGLIMAHGRLPLAAGQAFIAALRENVQDLAEHKVTSASPSAICRPLDVGRRAGGAQRFLP